jgi:hypothetical protein
MISLIRQNTFPIGGTTLCSQLKCVVGTCLLAKPASPFPVRVLTTVTVLEKQVTLKFLIVMTNSSGIERNILVFRIPKQKLIRLLG